MKKEPEDKGEQCNGKAVDVLQATYTWDWQSYSL